MPFNSGNLSFARYHISGQLPSQIDESMLEAINSHLFEVSEVGVPPEVEWGWAGPNHIEDRDISFDSCVFNECIHFAIRIDTNKVPAEVKKAMQLSAEAEVAKGNPSGFISKAQKRLVKDMLSSQLDDELRTGKHRRSKHVPILLDLVRREIYAPASVSVHEKLYELFDRTFPGCEIQKLTSGRLSMKIMEALSDRRSYEDATPTRFVKCQDQPDMPAVYPWVANGSVEKDYLGNEFLMWLWYTVNSNFFSEVDSKTHLVIDHQFDLDCIFSCSGKDSIRGTDPARMPEAFAAMRTGKVPRKMGVIMETAGDPFNFTICGESFAIAGLKFPDIEEAETPRHLFEERINHLRTFISAIDTTYAHFLKVRFNNWSRGSK